MSLKLLLDTNEQKLKSFLLKQERTLYISSSTFKLYLLRYSLRTLPIPLLRKNRTQKLFRRERIKIQNHTCKKRTKTIN